jgi:hypothetical protein
VNEKAISPRWAAEPEKIIIIIIIIIIIKYPGICSKVLQFQEII